MPAHVQFALRMPEDVKARAARAARLLGSPSLNAWINELIMRKLVELNMEPEEEK